MNGEMDGLNRIIESLETFNLMLSKYFFQMNLILSHFLLYPSIKCENLCENVCKSGIT